jgi:hypothetical protein
MQKQAKVDDVAGGLQLAEKIRGLVKDVRLDECRLEGGSVAEELVSDRPELGGDICEGEAEEEDM